MNKQKNFWIGLEVEGRFKGIPTLFIRGDQSIQQIILNLDDYNFIRHLYFGAGHQSKISNFETIRYFLKDNYVITIEVLLDELNKIPNWILKNKLVHIIVTIKNNYFSKLKDTDSIKLDCNKNIYVISKCNMFKTSLEEYKNDKKI